MISANEAKKQSEENRVKTTLEDIEKSIKKSIDKGNTQITKIGNLDKEIENILVEAGYKVEEQATGYKISWG